MEMTPIQLDNDDNAIMSRTPPEDASLSPATEHQMHPEDDVPTDAAAASASENASTGNPAESQPSPAAVAKVEGKTDEVQGTPESAGTKPDDEQDTYMTSNNNSENEGPAKKRARTEDQDNDEKREEEKEKEAEKIEDTAVSESPNKETNTIQHDAAHTEESKDKKGSQQQPPMPMMMQQHQPFPMAPGMMAHGGGGGAMMMGAGTPRQALMAMPTFYPAGFGVPFAFPSPFGVGAANMAMQQQHFAVQQQQQQMMMMMQQQQQQTQGAEKGKKKRKGQGGKSDKDSTTNKNKQQNPPQYPGHMGMVASGYSPAMFFPNAFFNPFGAVGPLGGNRPPVMADNRGIGLSLTCDREQLSDYQRFIRQHLELFEAGPEDCESNTQGRKRAVHLGQVGLRCRHCSHLPLRSRGRGAVYYPARLAGVYQAAQNMAQSHLTGSCERIPVHIKEELLVLRKRRDNASGGKQYWADGCRALGVYETEKNGLKLRQRDDPLLTMATSDATSTDPQLHGGDGAQSETKSD